MTFATRTWCNFVQIPAVITFLSFPFFFFFVCFQDHWQEFYWQCKGLHLCSTAHSEFMTSLLICDIICSPSPNYRKWLPQEQSVGVVIPISPHLFSFGALMASKYIKFVWYNYQLANNHPSIWALTFFCETKLTT